ncbi:AFR728Wp [Eremothecium gossypii ATCC 10895]|uniref:Outer kinetochore KNL1 complex subunit KRE28 n=1 Tax=Eremothecium gossypii (strain ATCC 10895 / CBS 109.51 / FGSC 9923 / NRRL Y-1056) TaxID=284811 RepID=ZWINT_EREGS|nr:AFR728Wp [Eremothecium gossypii ATCC 10895]Q751U7.2 RecName: Full=Spindle pole body component KRE28 [Eremothecium gossypii ATCC 10895]AAS54100.2 AFR728Wp [Eremothecium gossypii ATCC 10895]AEY98416.1 FAFR728Wp [Eremothecium gossypii FDAG1]
MSTKDTSGQSGYANDIRKLGEQTAHVSEQVLVQQERQRLGALEELHQSIIQIAEENSFVTPIKKDAANVHIDPRGIAVSVQQFKQLAEVLKVTHLEQETLDNFLRYTISDNDQLLDIKSVADSRYARLAEEVCQLEQEELRHLENEIISLNGNITEQTTKVIDANEKVKEECLEVSNGIERCWGLLNELETLRSTTDEGNVELGPLEETYQKWKSVDHFLQQKLHLKEQLRVLEDTRKSLSEVTKSSGNRAPDLDASEKFVTYRLLDSMWKKQFVDTTKIRDLELYPRTGKIQFQVADTIYVLAISGDQISNIQLFNDKLPAADLENNTQDLNKRFLGTSDVRRVVDFITHQQAVPQAQVH